MSIPLVTIDLTRVPFTGEAKLLLRLKPEDKHMIDLAAHKIGFNQAQFLRTVAINSARAILEAK